MVETLRDVATQRGRFDSCTVYHNNITNTTHIMKKPILTSSVSAGTRLYYIDLFKDSKGGFYLSVAEVSFEKQSKKQSRQRIIIHPEDIDKFSEAFNSVVGQMKELSHEE